MAANARILEIILRAKDESSKVFDQVSKSSATFSDKLGSVGKSATLGVSVPLAGAGIAVATLAANFETSMNVLQTNAGATGAEMQKLETYAKKMGAETVFSTQDAADGMLELSKAGMNTEQIMGGGLAAAMSIAATEGMALGDAATVTSNTMNMFGLKAGQAATIADTLAGASAGSTASVLSLTEGLAQVGPGAKNAGLSLNETVAVLAAFDDAGVKGSDAGTSLKTMLVSLVPKTDKAASMMKSLGLSFVDSKGNIDDVATVAQKLKDKLGPLSQEQRTAAMATMFGSDATRAASILMDQGATGIQKYIASTEQSGKAAEMAGARQKGAAGSIEAMMGSLESAGIALGQALLPIITNIAKDAAVVVNNFAGWWEAIGPGGQKVALILTAIVIAAGPLASIISVITGVVGLLSSAFVIEGVTAAAAWLATIWPVALVIAAIALVAGGIYLLIKNWGTIGPFFKKLWAGVTKAFSGFWSGTKTFVKKWGVEILAVLVPFIGVPLFIIKHWNVIGPALSKIWSGVSKGAKKGIDSVVGFVRSLPGRLLDALKGLAATITRPIDAAWNVLQKLNPFMRHSPSLVDNVLAGASTIASAYAGVSGISIASPTLGGLSMPAFAGAQSLGQGPSLPGQTGAGGQAWRIYLDGRELTRATAKTTAANGRSGAR